MADAKHGGGDPLAGTGGAAGASSVGLVPAPAPSSGDRQVLAGRYEILALVGAGAMGTVYRARDLELDEIVALKVLRRELLDAPESLEHFRREVKLSRRVTHRNVARVFDIGEHEGDRLLSMELVEGESLGAALARDGAFAVPRALEIARAIADGLGGAHAAGVIHRDLKPDNVLLAVDGRVVLTDFGVARAVAGAAGAVSTLGGLVGTPAYMAPEQVMGQHDVDARADIFAFGAVLYELLTGKLAWPGASPFATARLLAPPPDPRAEKPHLPPALAGLVVRCLARAREQRPASAEQVAAELAAIAAALPAPGVVATQASFEHAVATQASFEHAIATQASFEHAAPAPETGPFARRAPPPDRQASGSGLPADSDTTVAVLPFHNAGPPEDDYLAEEITDDLIDALSMTRGLRVRARSTVHALLGASRDAREIGREIGVEAIVEGSVRRAGGGVRMTARLSSVADGFQLWAKRFDRSAEDVLAINDEAARAIARVLGVDARAASREPPRDPVTVELYMRGRHEYRKFWPEAMRRALPLFEEALARSPGDPGILSAMAVTLARLSFFTEGQGTERALEVAERAVAAAPDAGEPHVALGSVLLQIGDAKAAARALRDAVTRAPGLAEAHAALGRVLAEVGADEAVRHLEAALLLDPDVRLARAELLRFSALLGRWEQAEAHLAGLAGDKPGLGYWINRARMALWRREPLASDDYARELARAEGPMAVPPRLVLALLTHGRLPPDAPDLRAMAAAPQRGVRGRLFLLQMDAEIHGFLGDRDRVVGAIEDAAIAGLIDRLWLERCPLLDEARDDPRLAPAREDVARRTDDILAAYRAP